MPQLVIRLGIVALSLLAGAGQAHAMELPQLTDSVANAMAQSPQAMAEYRRKLQEYQQARRRANRCARRLCSDAAAGLYRAEEAGRSLTATRAGTSPAQGDSNGA